MLSAVNVEPTIFYKTMIPQIRNTKVKNSTAMH